MKGLIAALGDVCMIVLAGTILVWIIGTEERLGAADRFLDSVVKRLECSCGEQREGCLEDARQKGYELEITELPSREGTVLCRITLQYAIFRGSAAGNTIKGRLQGYARY